MFPGIAPEEWDRLRNDVRDAASVESTFYWLCPSSSARLFPGNGGIYIETGTARPP